jgi:hypothetical protein
MTDPKHEHVNGQNYDKLLDRQLHNQQVDRFREEEELCKMSAPPNRRRTVNGKSQSHADNHSAAQCQ